MDSTNQERRPAVARAHCDVFRLAAWVGEVIQMQHFYHHGHTLPSKVRLRNDQTPRNVYVWMQQ